MISHPYCGSCSLLKFLLSGFTVRMPLGFSSSVFFLLYPARCLPVATLLAPPCLLMQCSLSFLCRCLLARGESLWSGVQWRGEAHRAARQSEWLWMEGSATWALCWLVWPWLLSILLQFEKWNTGSLLTEQKHKIREDFSSLTHRRVCIILLKTSSVCLEVKLSYFQASWAPSIETDHQGRQSHPSGFLMVGWILFGKRQDGNTQ